MVPVGVISVSMVSMISVAVVRRPCMIPMSVVRRRKGVVPVGMIPSSVSVMWWKWKLGPVPATFFRAHFFGAAE